ncbi:hypothetical protein GCM10020331_074910 [Ectobacillus funiculus]
METEKEWDLSRRDGGVSILPPYQCENGARWYDGTAHAIYQNAHFIEQYDPEYVLVISGDHIYKMDYDKNAAAAYSFISGCYYFCHRGSMERSK